MDGENIFIVDPATGKRGYVPRSDLAHWEKAGYVAESGEQTERARLKEEYGDSEIQAGLEGAASGITFGLSDVALSQLDEEGVKARAEFSPGARMAGEIGGGLLTAGIGPGKALAQAGEGVAARVAGEGAGLGRRVLGGAAQGAVEGAGYGLGMGTSKLALSDEPLTWEGAAATLGSEALAGAGLGAGIGAGAKMLGEGASQAKEFAKERIEKFKKGRAAEETLDRSKHPDIAGMDQSDASKALDLEKAAKEQRVADEIAQGKAELEAETARLNQLQTEDAERAYQEAKAFKDVAGDSENFIPALSGEERSMFKNSTGKLRGGLNNETGFINSRGGAPGRPGQFHQGLQEHETVLKQVLEGAEDVIANADDEAANFLNKLPKPKEALPSVVPELGVQAETKVPRGFHDEVMDAVARVPESGRFGEHQAFISEIYKQMETKMPYSDFKEALAKEIQAGRLKGSAADLVGVMNPEQVQFSSTKLAGATDDSIGTGRIHFIDSWDTPISELGAKRAAARAEQAAGAAKPKSSFTEVAGEGAQDVAAKRGPGRPKKFGFKADTPRPEGHYLDANQSYIYKRWRLGKAPGEKVKPLKVTDAELAAFRSAVENGEVIMPAVERVQKAQMLLEENRKLQARLEDLQAKPSSEALRAIENRLDQAKAGVKIPTEREMALRAHLADLQKKDLFHHIAQGIGGTVGGSLGGMLGGNVGAMAGAFMGRDFGIQLYERFVKKIKSANSARANAIQDSVKQLFEGTGKAVKAIPKASAIMPSMRYAAPERVEAALGPSTYKPSKNDLVNAFRDRARELNAMTERTATGFKIRLDAATEIHERMAGVWAANPEVANGIEKTQFRKLEYLASKLPRDPTPEHLQVGPDKWEPSQAQMAQFARTMEVVEHPEKAVQRLAQGTATPDDIDALKSVWPAHYQMVRDLCIRNMNTLQKQMPYQNRLNLSILMDVPADPALTQMAQSVYQKPAQPPAQAGPPPGAQKPMPVGMYKPTNAQRISST